MGAGLDRAAQHAVSQSPLGGVGAARLFEEACSYSGQFAEIAAPAEGHAIASRLIDARRKEGRTDLASRRLRGKRLDRFKGRPLPIRSFEKVLRFRRRR